MKTTNRCCRALVALLALLAAGAAGVSCAEDPVQDVKQLTATDKWVLESWSSDVDLPDPDARRPWLSFEKRKFHGNAGVNHVSGSHDAKGDGSFEASMMAMTKMAGEPAAMKTETTFTTLLDGVTRWSMDGEILVLSDGTQKLELRFKPFEPEKALPLTGTEWMFQGFETTEGEAVSFTPAVAGTTLTLLIGEDGRASGSAGVNRYFGKAKQGEGEAITFGPMASTRRAGPPEAMKQEHAYLKQLEAVASWRVEVKRLILANADGTAALVFEAK